MNQQWSALYPYTDNKPDPNKSTKAAGEPFQSQCLLTKNSNCYRDNNGVTEMLHSTAMGTTEHQQLQALSIT